MVRLRKFSYSVLLYFGKISHVNLHAYTYHWQIFRLNNHIKAILKYLYLVNIRKRRLLLSYLWETVANTKWPHSDSSRGSMMEASVSPLPSPRDVIMLFHQNGGKIGSIKNGSLFIRDYIRCVCVLNLAQVCGACSTGAIPGINGFAHRTSREEERPDMAAVCERGMHVYTKI